MRSTLRIFRALAVLVCLVTAGCSKRGASADWRVAFDPELVDRTPGSFHQSFDGSPSRLVLGTGWYGIENISRIGPLEGFSWAASSATVYFGMPSFPAVELAARCAPFSFPGAPIQTLSPVLNGRELPTVVVLPDWHELRLRLPASLLRAPINELQLRFSYALAPAKVSHSDDVRELSVLFDEMAILPQGDPLSGPVSSIHEAVSGLHEVKLSRAGLAIPLPAGNRLRVRVGRTQASDAGLEVAVDLWSGSLPPRGLWKGPAADFSGLEMNFASQDTGISMIRFRLRAAGGEPTPPSATLIFDLSVPEVVRSPPRMRARPDVFLYLIDTLRADELGLYGSSLGLTPRIDAFARDAVVFDHAWSAAPWTLPATTSILSGVYPFEHGAIDVGDTVPSSGLPWLPEELSRIGYETAAFLQWPFGKSLGLERGFDRSYLDVRLMTKSRSEIARGLFWQHLFYRRQPERPLFAYIHVSDPHAVYDPKGPDRELAEHQPGTLPPQFYNPQVFLTEGFGKSAPDVAHLRALYDGEVRYTDRQFGAFLDLLRYLGLYDESLIILVADHGEEFYDHGGFDHGRTLYEELLHVPLIVKYPQSLNAESRVKGRVSTLDLTPTVLKVLGRPFGEQHLQGRPLPVHDAAGEGDSREVFAESRIGPSRAQGPVDLLGVAAGELKCTLNRIVEDRFHKPVKRPLEVYDLTKDPAERSPLEESDPRVGVCRDRIGRWLVRESQVSQRKGVPERGLSTEEINRLRALGYLR